MEKSVYKTENKSIVVINLNPAFDVHYNVPDFKPYSESYGTLESRNIGGKGVNVALSLRKAGCDPICVCVLGKDNAAEFKEKLCQSGVRSVCFEADGAVRENITIHKSGFADTRVSLDNFKVDEKCLFQVSQYVCGIIKPNSIVALCGRLPGGVDVEAVCQMLSSFKEKGARLVVDSNSFDASHLMKIAPWMIKPNEHEIAAMLPQEQSKDNLSAARLLCKGGIENVLVTLGEKGAFLVSTEGCFECGGLEIDPVSCVGAGDSTVAGFLYAVTNGKSRCEALKYACAFGTAACLEAGTNPPSMEKIRKLVRQINVSKL